MNRGQAVWVAAALGLALATWAWLGGTNGDGAPDGSSGRANPIPSNPQRDPASLPTRETPPLAPELAVIESDSDRELAQPTTDDPLPGETDAAPATAAPNSTAATPDVESSIVPLEDLLRVPESEEFPQPDSGEIASDENSDAFQGPARDDMGVRIDARRQRDALEEDPSQKREQVDAGASVDIDENTRIRGGVRIERDPDRPVTETEEVETAPMIGVEKRF